MYQLKKVEKKSDWSDFVQLPWEVYRGDPYWVPPLRVAVRELLDVRKNPFFKHASMYPVLVYQDGKCVGRMVGIIDDLYNEFHHEKVAFFGFFETSKNDQKLVNLLLDEIACWGKSRGMTSLRGPMNPSINHECGLLVEGFQDSPAVMTTYNPPDYAKLLESWGLTKAKDLYAFKLHKDKKIADRLLIQAERLKKNNAFKFRTINMKDFDNEVERVLSIYNDAWETNWGFVPMQPEEFRHMAKDMKAILDPNLLLIAEVRGEPAGFALTLPDVNQAIKKVKNGKLFPTGLIKLLWNLKGPGRKKTITRVRIVTLGIKKAYRECGLGPLLYTEYFRRGPELGYAEGEASWILEDNLPMNRALEQMRAERTKVYRIYDARLN